MITEEQEKWVKHLDLKKIDVFPYNPKTKEVFEKVKNKIQKFLGNVGVSHCGSTGLGISGKGEIDLYVPVAPANFDKHLVKMTENLGKPRSIYPARRARWVEYVDDIMVEIFLINKECQDWTSLVIFEGYLKNNPEELKSYENLKKNANGANHQDYARGKIEFINYILEKAKNG